MFSKDLKGLLSVRSRYIINTYPIREVVDSVITSQGFWVFKWDGSKYWKTPDRIYHVSKSYRDWFELTALEVHYKNFNIRDNVKYSYYDDFCY